MKKPSLRIAVVGLGTVGIGVLEILKKNVDLLFQRSGRNIEVVSICARDINKQRKIPLNSFFWEKNINKLPKDENIDVILELVGGSDGVALDLVENSLKAKKHVITANKALIAKHGNNLINLAEENNVSLKFEASVAGGIPCIKTISESLSGNRIKKIIGVLNGTCNYILTEMENNNKSYEEVFKEAQNLGYVESNPKLDIGGIDSAQKLSILSALAFGTKIYYNSENVNGIENINLEDIKFAKSMGYRIKLLSVSERTSDGIFQNTAPSLISKEHMISNLEGGTNLVSITGDFVNEIILQGLGAGDGPTASAVISDLIDVALSNHRPILGQTIKNLKFPIDYKRKECSCYYIRFNLADEPGSLAKVANILGNYKISIDRMKQIKHKGDKAPLIIVTHKCQIDKISIALKEINKLDVCLQNPTMIRIEDI